MYEFRELMDYIWTILMQAQSVIEEALENKDDNPDLGAAYYHVAGNHMTDVDMLMKQAEACLLKAEKTGHEDHERMRAAWDTDHKRLIKLISNVKIYMDMYR